MTRDHRHGSKATPADTRNLSVLLGRGARIILVAALTFNLAAGPALADRSNGRSGMDKGPDFIKARLAPDLLSKIGNQSSNYRDENVRLLATLNGVADVRGITDRVEKLGGKVRGHYNHVRQIALEMPFAGVPDLIDVVGLEYVAPDRPVSGSSSHLQVTTGASQVYPPDFGTPLSAFLISGGLRGYDGTGIGVAVVDSGIDPEHYDLRDSGRKRTVVSVDFVGRGSLDDPYGHGTHIAGIIAGNGAASRQAGYDYSGIATGANLINLKVLDEYGRGYSSSVVAAIDFAIANRGAYNIRVINLSLAAPPVESYRDDPLCQAVDRAARYGLVVVASAGNFGLNPDGFEVYGGVTSPGISPVAITVGATQTRGSDKRSDDAVAPYSSRGPTRSRSVDPVTGAVTYDNLAKPDLVAPGLRVVSLERYDNTLVRNFPYLHVDTGSSGTRTRYMVLSGTSMSAAVVSGTAALILQANPSLTPNMVKAILMYSAQLMDGEDLFEQGAGMLNVEGALRLARSMKQTASTVPVGQKLLASAYLPKAESTIAGETFAWSRGVVWNDGWVSGTAVMTQQQDAYSQSLIWGDRRMAWGAGATFFDGLYSDRHVVFGQGGEWRYVTWDSGTTLDGGLVFRDDLAATGVEWNASQIDDTFFTIDPATLIWGYSRYARDLSLIWTFEQSLIWGYGLRDSSLIWGAL